MPRDEGFRRYQAHYERQPAIVVEWRDRETDAAGWLCIDSLRGGAAGGGTRMTATGSREEAVFLAKAMAIKFQVCGPDIGGGKSVIRFNYKANPKAKRAVLERWYRHIGPYLKSCYGTGGDVGVDEVSEATAITSQIVGIKHPQEGIARGGPWKGSEGPGPKLSRLKRGVEARVTLPDLPGPRKGAWMIADVITGYGVARSIEHYYRRLGRDLDGQRVIVEGFGAVGAFAAYYLAKQGALLVATSTREPAGPYRVALNPKGLDVSSLIHRREHTSLPAPGRSNPDVVQTDNPRAIYSIKADIFVPAAVSHTLGSREIASLRHCGVKVMAPGANNPFAYNKRHHDLHAWASDMLALQRVADRHLAVIPDFVANSGMARAFGYLMAPGAKTDSSTIIRDCEKAIDRAVDRILDGDKPRHGLLERAYRAFVPE